MNKRLRERAEIRFIFSKELKQCFALSSMLTVQGASLMNDSTFKEISIYQELENWRICKLHILNSKRIKDFNYM